MLTVILYTRKECHLCDDVKEILNDLQEEQPHELVEVDVESDPALEASYGAFIPVVQVGPYTRKAPITRQDLLVSLSAARDREQQLVSLDDPGFKYKQARRSKISTGDRISFWLANHYMFAANLIIFLYVGLSFLAPVFMKVGWTAPANVIYRSYSLVCHNLGYRSWFLFGDQAAYPRAAANVDGLRTFEEISGLAAGNDTSDLLSARRFVGDEQLGYKVAFCERDVAIYTGILLFGLIFAFTGARIKSLHWLLWILIGFGPIGLDGFSQLLSQPPFNWLGYRESTPFLRSLTGFLFGVTTAWYGFPIVAETMQEAKRSLLVKFKRLGKPIN